MKDYKYIMQTGFAFDEEKQMERLKGLAKEGWLLSSFAYGGFAYKLQKSEPQDVCYSLDYYQGTEEELEEYFEVFRASGWEPICHTGNVHIFRAKEGTPPLYTEGETLEEKYLKSRTVCLKTTLISISLTVLFIGLSWIFNHFSFPNIINNAFNFVAFMAYLIFVPSLMMAISYSLKMKKISQRDTPTSLKDIKIPFSLHRLLNFAMGLGFGALAFALLNFILNLLN